MKEQITMIVFVILLGIVAAGILVGTDGFTAQIISDNEAYALKSNILNAFELEFTDDSVDQVYDASITESTEGDYDFYYTEDGSVGFLFEGKGLWGPIRGFMTLTSDYETIKGIQVLYNEETPGLGGIIGEQWYLDTFKGKKFDPEIIVKKDADVTSISEVDAITGATSTSSAFQLIINENYQARKEALGQ